MSNPFIGNSGPALSRWLTSRPSELAFDIGAHKGGYTETLLLLGAKRVVCFEPLPALAEMVRTRYASDGRVEVHQLAMGEISRSERNLSVLNCWTLADKDKTHLEPVPDFLGQTFDVDFSFIDSGKFGDPDFLKIDADGYEPAILRGATKLLTEKRPTIFLELSYLPQDLGDSCDRMIYDMYVKHRYVFVSESGEYVCRSHREMLGYFPWNTSYDVLAVPVEQSSFFA